MSIRSCLCGWAQTGERIHHGQCPVHDEQASLLASVYQAVQEIRENTEKIMSQDAQVMSVVEDLQAQNTQLQNLISTVVAELQAGGGVSDATMAALQAVDASIDQTVSGFASDVTPPAPPAAPETVTPPAS